MLKTNIFLKIVCLLLCCYTALFIVSKTGYYERKISQKTSMTEEKMKEFEEDLENGVALDMKKYLPEKKDYNNSFTKFLNNISLKIGSLLKGGVDFSIKVFKSLFIY